MSIFETILKSPTRPSNVDQQAEGDQSRQPTEDTGIFEDDGVDEPPTGESVDHQ